MIGPSEPAAPRALLARERDRVVDRLRSLPLRRLGAAWPPGQPMSPLIGTTPAGTAHALAQWCADAAAGVMGRPELPVPRLADAAVGDQVTVTVTDLLAADPPDEVTAGALERLTALRRAL